MRPRVFPAEDPHGGGSPSTDSMAASMRPRVFPAEDALLVPSQNISVICFNEAAGIPRGRQGAVGAGDIQADGFNEAAGIPRGRRTLPAAASRPLSTASMRPRVFPAEDGRRALCARSGASGLQ